MRNLLAPILAWMVAGCSITIDDHWDREELREAIREATAEVNVHHARLDAALTLGAARAEVDRHALAIDGLIGHVRSHVYDMRCSGSGEAMMAGLMSSVSARRHEYLDEAYAAPTLWDVREAVHAYAEELDDLFDALLYRADRSDCWTY